MTASWETFEGALERMKGSAVGAVGGKSVDWAFSRSLLLAGRSRPSEELELVLADFFFFFCQKTIVPVIMPAKR